jgi:hypothetical protein
MKCSVQNSHGLAISGSKPPIGAVAEHYRETRVW